MGERISEDELASGLARDQGFQFVSEFAPEDRVNIDGDKSIRAMINRVAVNTSGQIEYELVWIHNGGSYHDWFPTCRISPAID